MKNVLTIHPDDNVAVALSSDAGAPFGHKLALTDIPKGGAVIKYGFRIGRAGEDIKAGQHVHTHNLRTGLGENCEYRPGPPEPARGKIAGVSASNTFMGFKRSSGKTRRRYLGTVRESILSSHNMPEPTRLPAMPDKKSRGARELTDAAAFCCLWLFSSRLAHP